MDRIIDTIYRDADFASACDSIKKQHLPLLINGVCDNAVDFLIKAIHKRFDKKLLIILKDEKSVYTHSKKLESLGIKTLVFPARDFIFDNIAAFSKEFEQQRISVLYKLFADDYDAVITVPDAVMQYTIPEETLRNAIIDIDINSPIAPDDMVERLVLAGYKQCDTVEGQGQFARRGGIIDVFSPYESNPCRIDYFGDDIDAMGIFDIVTQRRTENIKKYICTPINELIANINDFVGISDSITSLLEKKGIDEKYRDELKKELSFAESGQLPTAKDKYFSLVYKQKCFISDYMGDFLSVICESKRVFERARSFSWEIMQTLEALANEGKTNFKNTEVCTDEKTLFSVISKKAVCFDYFFESGSAFQYASSINMVTKTVPSFGGSLDQLSAELDELLSPEFYTIMLTGSGFSANTASAFFDEHGIGSLNNPRELGKNIVNIIPTMAGGAFGGFELPKACLCVISDGEDTAKTGTLKARAGVKRFKKSEKIASYADLSVGDYVVHANHGIGIYMGLAGLSVEGTKKDYIKIQYAGKDVLYVPCNQLDLVSKYIGGGNESSVKISKMSSGEWQKAKNRAKSAAKNIAKELIRLYAERRQRKGFAFSPDGELQEEFEAMFDYAETDGQLTATEEIKKDMELEAPMERLLCGDVGFGKTEVALRAAFKAVCDGKQVAILVPTTILAMQHNNTIKSRFRGFPVNFEMLSRFKTKRQQDEIFSGIKSGKTDIVVGTHKLLQKNIEFKNLGLLIVDEEQRFGVTHKEKLKELASNIDVLTLTATPIPRTLNMALSGIRDMSVLEEAPMDRLPVQSYVLEHDDEIINEAIRRELRRGGQVFYLHNVVDTIYAKANGIAKCFPNNTVAIAHGKMDKEELSDIWQAMVNGEIDILVCTTIIETGVDISNANTLIIEDANRLGLSQLHQIRGRVGRSPRRAYAYFTYRRGTVLTEIAEKRLAAIKEFTEFGSGFKIAMRDLELRGAGNLLGAEQSGHMAAIGYDLYIKILEEAVNQEKGIDPPVKRDCLVEIVCDAYIPEDYINSAQIRIDVYRKIALIDNASDKDDLLDELIDRFGDLPQSTENLLYISLSRNIASKADIKHISQKGSIIAFFPSELDIQKCSCLTKEPVLKGRVMISASGKPHFAIKVKPGDNTVKLVMETLNIYTKL